MLSYFKYKEEDKIIIGALNGNLKDLNYLFVYASRFKELQRRSDKSKGEKIRIPFSKTGNHNLKQISSGLIIALVKEYSEINYDYITSFKNIGPKSLSRIKKCIEIGTRIYRYIRTDITFAEIIVNELAGGNKFQWLSINQKGEIIDRENLNALNLIRNTSRLIKYSDEMTEEEANDILADNLLSSLDKKYLTLRRTQRQLIKKNGSIKFREAIYNCLISYRIGSIIFPKAAKDFCETPIKELSGKDSIVNWFYLSNKPDLHLNQECLKIKGINPKEMLEYFVFLQKKFLYWEEIRSDLMQTEYDKLKTRAYQIYNRTNNTEYLISDRNISNAKQVLEGLEMLSTCYSLHKDRDILESIYSELVGNGIFFWFELARSGLFIEVVLKCFPSKGRGK